MAKVIFPDGTPEVVKQQFANFFRDVYSTLTPAEIEQFDREWDAAEMESPLYKTGMFTSSAVNDRVLNVVANMVINNAKNKRQRRTTKKTHKKTK